MCAQTFGIAVYSGFSHSQYKEGDNEALRSRAIDFRAGGAYTVMVDTALRLSLGVEIEGAAYELDYMDVMGPTTIGVRMQRVHIPLLGYLRFHSTERDELRALVGASVSMINQLEVDQGLRGNWRTLRDKKLNSISIRAGVQYGYFLSHHWRLFGELFGELPVARGDNREPGALVPSGRIICGGVHIGVGFTFNRFGK